MVVAIDDMNNCPTLTMIASRITSRYYRKNYEALSVAHRVRGFYLGRSPGSYSGPCSGSDGASFDLQRGTG
jgi:hypothetical protein